jgi:hypothetical protein
MSCRSRSALAVAAALAFLGRAGAVAPEVKDEAKFFSADAVKKANEQLRDIWVKYGHDFLLEAFATPPADQVEKVKQMTAGERQAFFRKWAMERAKLRAVKGAYVIVCKDPEYLLVGLTDTNRLFKRAARAKITEAIRKEFGEKHYDDGLLAGIKVAADLLAAARK